MKTFEIRSFSDKELDEMYGERKINVGFCFSVNNEHFYMQRKNDVLHISNNIINTLHEGYLNNLNISSLIPMLHTEFVNKIREIIYQMDIGKYWKLI